MIGRFAEQRIAQPVFIVGSGRSGTTLLYHLLAGHREFGWFSNVTSRFPRLPYLAVLNTLSRSSDWRSRWSPLPAEGYRIWDYCHPIPQSAGSRPLLAKDVSEVGRKRLVHSIGSHLYFGRAQRFLNKNTRNTRRVGYLNAIFDDAIFVHLVRDGRAVTNSLLKVPFWSELPLWWFGGVTPRVLQAKGEDSVLLAARHWEMNVVQFAKDSHLLRSEQLLQIRYEDLVSEPEEVLRRVLDFCNLSWDASFTKHCASFSFQDRNTQANRLSEEELRRVENCIGDTLRLFGYD